MIALKVVEQETLAVKRSKRFSATVEKPGAKSALTRVKTKKKTGEETGKSPPKAWGDSSAVQMEVEQDRRAKTKGKRVRAKAKSSKAKIKRAARSQSKKEELPPARPGNAGAEQRVSFVVRLTVDERGQPRRTEIEHAQSGKKEVFPALDIQHLASFMQACINSISPKPAIPTIPATVKTLIPTSEAVTLAVSLTIVDVQVFRVGTPEVMALTLAPDESFQIQIRFRLQGPDALSLAVQPLPFNIKVYTKEVTSGRPSLLTTYSANLVKDAAAYTAQTQPLSLPGGLYRLTTLVTLEAPVKLAGFLEGPVVQVAGV